MNTKKSMKHLTIPKSDQLNSEQLINAPITITVAEVVEVNNPQQPLIIHYDGENGRPYKPCKTMMKLLEHGWTEFYEDWVGRSMTLFCDPEVDFGADKRIGGIRISHMSHIPSKMEVSLLKSKQKKKLYTVLRLTADNVEDHRARLIAAAQLGVDEFNKAWTATPIKMMHALGKPFKDEQLKIAEQHEEQL